MIRPVLAFIMPRIAARHRLIDAVIFTSSTESQSSSFIRINNPSRVMPALLTRIDIGPASALAASTRPATASRSDKSTASAKARAPRSFCNASSFSARVPCSTTVAPCACRARATASPIPPLAPVTSAVLPVRSNINQSPFADIATRYVSSTVQPARCPDRQAHPNSPRWRHQGCA